MRSITGVQCLRGTTVCHRIRLLLAQEAPIQRVFIESRMGWLNVLAKLSAAVGGECPEPCLPACSSAMGCMHSLKAFCPAAAAPRCDARPPSPPLATTRCRRRHRCRPSVEPFHASERLVSELCTLILPLLSAGRRRGERSTGPTVLPPGEDCECPPPTHAGCTRPPSLPRADPHLSPAHTPMQIYVPRLPGIPNEYPYHPDAFGLAYEDIWLTAADGVRLHAWLMWPPHWSEEQRRSRPTVMFFQENAGNMAFRCAHPACCALWSTELVAADRRCWRRRCCAASR